VSQPARPKARSHAAGILGYGHGVTNLTLKAFQDFCKSSDPFGCIILRHVQVCSISINSVSVERCRYFGTNGACGTSVRTITEKRFVPGFIPLLLHTIVLQRPHLYNLTVGLINGKSVSSYFLMEFRRDSNTLISWFPEHGCLLDVICADYSK
jgi:hypothetical protein